MISTGSADSLRIGRFSPLFQAITRYAAALLSTYSEGARGIQAVSNRERKSEMLMGKITKHRAGEFVPGGIYWNRKSWELTPIEEEGGRLPTENDATYYYQLPLLLVMALAPLAGLAFILFLATAVPVMIIYSAFAAIGRALHRVRRPPGTLRT